MQQIHSVVHQARRRVWMNLFLRSLPWTLTGALTVLLVTRLVQQILGVVIPNISASTETGFVLGYREIILGLLGASLISSLIYMIVKRPSAIAIAREVDERAELKESLSTALCMEKTRETDPWAHSMINTAEERARTVKVAQILPMEWTRAWAYPVAASVALLLVWTTVKNFDLMNITKKRDEIVKKQADVVVAKTQVKKSEEEIKKALDKAGIAMKEDEKGEPFSDASPEPTKADEILRGALKNLTKAADKLNEAKESEQAKELAAMKDMMEQLKAPGPGPMDEMSRMMARGEFGKAEQALQELSKQLAAGSMSPSAKEQMAKQMQNMAKQLQNLSQTQKNAAETLKKAGLDEKTAQEIAKKMQTDPAAAKEQLQKELEEQKKQSGDKQTPEQKKAEDQAKSMCEAGMKCNSMGEKMGQMAQNMSKDGMSQEGQEAMSQMGEQMSEMEQAQQNANNIADALSDIQQQMQEMGGNMQGNQSGKLHNSDMVGEFMEGEEFSQGGGSGGPGRSGGGRGPEEEQAQYTIVKEKADVKTQKGQIISSRLVWGEQVKGESVAEFTDAVERGQNAAAEAFETMRVHREYQGAVRHYFGRLEEAAKKAKSGAATPATAPATAPAQAPKDAVPAQDAKPADKK